jgi:hypothetical protein
VTTKKFDIRLAVVVLIIVATTGPTPWAQAPRMKQVMRAKLDHSQRLLEAVVTSNWQLLDPAGRS